MAGELGSLVLVDGVGDVGIGTLDMNLAAHTALGSVPSSALRNNTGARRGRWARGHALLGRGGFAEFGDELAAELLVTVVETRAGRPTLT